MSELTPQQELDMGTSLTPDMRDKIEIRPLKSEEDGTVCLGCDHKIRFRPVESRQPTRYVAVLVGGGMCCSKFCVEVELGRRDAEDQHEEDQAMQWAEDMGYLGNPEAR